MFTATAIVTALLALMATLSGIGKLAKHPKIVENMGHVNAPLEWLPRLAAAEFAGATGMVIGLFVWPWLGVAAAIGIALYFVGALIFHVRANDKDIAGPIVFLVLAIAAAVLRAVTA